MENMVANELGDDIDLLLKPDAWLENYSLELRTQMTMLAEQLDKVCIALRTKCELQQKNMVAVRTSTDAIEFHALPDAIYVLEQNVEEQERIWSQDGYDIVGARRLRKQR